MEFTDEKHENITFKKPLLIDEQIKYLKDNKRVVFNIIKEDEAKEILSKYGYINVITPFKYKFAKKDDKNKEIRDEHGNHIYDRDVEFSEYYSFYTEERNKYPELFRNISKFENIFNSIVSYESIHYYNIENINSFDTYITKLKLNAHNSFSGIKLYEAINRINTSSENIKKLKSIYIFLDRLSFNETITYYECSEEKLQKIIFTKMLEKNNTLGCLKITDFNNEITKLGKIRNYVYHNNSLNILIRYKEVGQKLLRSKDAMDSYRKLIKKML